ncbi:ribosomal protein L20 [Batrachochytrium salamandrivorans]|nr:ribosomal protein L20 [Batrachochytrium salamandrivorans]
MRKEKILELARGYWGKGGNCNAIARATVEKGLSRQKGDRHLKKRNTRRLWIQQVNAGCREHDLPYNKLMYGLSQAKVEVNRKVLSDLARNEPLSFRSLVEVAKVFW